MEKGIIWLRKISVSQKDNLILSDVNLTVRRGEFTYLIGKTGSGKTSLLKLLYGALALQTGEAWVAGHDLSTLNRKSIPLLRRKLGIVFQDFNLLQDRNVYHNLSFVLKATGWTDKNEMDQRIKSVLEKVSLLKMIHKMPHELSGGEQQKVVIARALINDPQLILADEPTGNLDPETSNEIVELIGSLAKENQVTVLFATHDYRIIEDYPGRIIRCYRGQVIDEGNFVS